MLGNMISVQSAALLVVSVQYGLITSLQSALFPVVITTIESYLGVSNTSMAALVAVYDFVQVAASFPFAAMCLRFGCSRTLSLSACFSVGGAFMFALSTEFWMLVVAQIAMGVGSAAVTVLCPHFMTVISTSTHEASFKLSIAYASASGGVVIGYLCAGIVGTNNWRLLFLVNGLALIPVVFLLASKQDADLSPPADNKVSSPREEDDSVLADDVVGLVGGDLNSFLQSIKTVMFCHPTVALSVLSQSCIGFGVAALIAFIPKFVTVVLQQSTSVAAFMMAATVPATALGVVCTGTLARKFKLSAFQLLQLITCCCATSLTMLAMFLTTSVPLFLVMLVVEMFVIFASMVPSVMIFAQLLPPHLVPFANAFSNASVRLLGSVPGPIALGALLDLVGSANLERVQHCYLAVGLFSLASATMFILLALKSFKPIV